MPQDRLRPPHSCTRNAPSPRPPTEDSSSFADLARSPPCFFSSLSSACRLAPTDPTTGAASVRVKTRARASPSLPPARFQALRFSTAACASWIQPALFDLLVACSASASFCRSTADGKTPGWLQDGARAESWPLLSDIGVTSRQATVGCLSVYLPADFCTSTRDCRHPTFDPPAQRSATPPNRRPPRRSMRPVPRSGRGPISKRCSI